VADSPGEWCARMARVGGKRTRRDAADDEDDIGGDVARRCENDRRPSRVVSTTCLSSSTVLTSAKRYASYQVTFARGVIIRWVYKKSLFSASIWLYRGNDARYTIVITEY